MKMCNHRLIALALSCLLCFTAVPITAFAVGAAGTEETMTEETGTEAVTASVEEMTRNFHGCVHGCGNRGTACPGDEDTLCGSI